MLKKTLFWVSNPMRAAIYFPEFYVLFLCRNTPITQAFLRPSSVTPALFSMPRGVKKENLPCKLCLICNRPFTWRKKWEKCWDEVSVCSKSCNRKRRSSRQHASKIFASEESHEVLGSSFLNEENQTVFSNPERNIEEQTEDIFVAPDSEIHAEDGDKKKILINSCVKLDDGFHFGSDGNDKPIFSVNEMTDEDDDPIQRRKMERKAAKKAKKTRKACTTNGSG
mmetsp:Transcript_27587/g.63242  ORF Transcript_27587/g.63242 Transcript_27587/m.63242 type:complete len:224 (-) Transcript_27587:240-911(-)